ncbi:MAG: type V CRISPR-associated protein Cas12b [Kiritimatiellae bacterium]|nr:type V CRISPR-associated protein Cas12b [Kiritimatiellia bacterium]
MTTEKKPSTTQRAYTLRLRGVTPDDQSWRNALWQTHEAVNKGAKVFGDWLLTMRGGLDHTLAEAKTSDEERKARRILLALSWLSVESKSGAPEKFTIASGQDSTEKRNRAVIAALEEILKSRGLAETEIAAWKTDCAASLSANIRDDAVWVNRSNAFDLAVMKRIGSSLTREEVWDMLERFFGSRDAYLAPAKGSEDKFSGTEQEEKAKDLVQKAGQWLSSRFGIGKGADFCRMAEVYETIATWAGESQAGTTGNQAIVNLAAALIKYDPASEDLNGVLGLISGPGYKSATRNLLSRLSQEATVTQQNLDDLKNKAAEDAEQCKQKSGSKGQRPYADAILNDVESDCGFTYRVGQNGQPVLVAGYSNYSDDYKWGTSNHSEYAVMLDHAARRVSLAHTWIKCAEAERRRFEEDAGKADHISWAAKDWLDQFCQERSETSGALEPYRIRRRALDGWKEVVASWSKPSCSTSAERIAAARALQDETEGKFGDIQLFEALAEDDALCIWHKDGDAAKAPDPQPMIDYALAAEAEFKKRRFKVPAYRHPDALLHPIFCDFGNSRWEIEFSIHKTARERNRAIANAQNAVATANTALEKDKENEKKQSKLQEAEEALKEAKEKRASLPLERGVEMKLWNGEAIAPTPMCWQSKRLANDLALGQDTANESPIEVSRADRLGRAAANAPKKQGASITGLFEQKNWNGRLQAPREQLEAIAAVRDNPSLSDQERDRRISAMVKRIRWLASFSAKLQPQGPWFAFIENASDKTAFTHVSNSGEMYLSQNGWPHNTANKARKGHAQLILCRLPGLRLLSVDLGHRYAAACAVWEAMSSAQVAAACETAGHAGPKESDLYLHLKRKRKKHKKGQEVEVEETTVYRRIGADTLPDGKKHPAPWARLDRQFLIKLQGEEQPVREALNEEIWTVHQMEVRLGRSRPIIDRLVASGWGRSDKQRVRCDALERLGWAPAAPSEAGAKSDEDEDGNAYRPSLSVDELMSSAVRTARLALQRHGDRARIAHYLVTDKKTMPGGIPKELSDDGRIELLQDALLIWHDLFSSRGWRDDAARELWNAHIVGLAGYSAIEEPGAEASGAERKKRKKTNREQLRKVAEALVHNPALRVDLQEKWKKRWQEDDECWKKRLRQMKDWILPRGKAATGPAIRNVGGLSLTRLATLTEFRRKVQVGFFTRLKPDGTKAETKEQFGQRALDALDQLREQRVKQLASRIVEAALGVGRVKRSTAKKDLKRPAARVDEPCHAIVIENLTHYRPEETRSRRENRQLMSWSSSKVQKYLSEACELNGLHLREVSASYTSRQDSRTGAPGIRCLDVPVKEFMHSPFWQKQVVQAEKKEAAGEGDEREILLCALAARYKGTSDTDPQNAVPLRIPLKGGEIFVSADPHSPAAKGLQADLNAAANIGLRALSDPDWYGKWWYVPCDTKSLVPQQDKVDGSRAFKSRVALAQPPHASPETEPARRKKGDGKTKEVVNLWRDISCAPLDDHGHGAWKKYADYQNDVQNRVIGILKKQMRATAEEDDIPY